MQSLAQNCRRYPNPNYSFTPFKYALFYTSYTTPKILVQLISFVIWILQQHDSPKITSICPPAQTLLLGV